MNRHPTKRWAYQCEARTEGGRRCRLVASKCFGRGVYSCGKPDHVAQCKSLVRAADSKESDEPQ
jgi:hypothetical protein